MSWKICLAALVVLALFAGCDSRTDQTACNQYADTISSLGCDDGAADNIRDFCAREPVDPCADSDSSECVSFWDCLSQRATCDVDERFRGNETCAIASDVETTEDIAFD